MGVPGCPDFACCTASMHRVRMVLMQSSSIGPRGVFISYPAKSNPFPFRHIGERVGGPLKDLFQRPINVHDNRNIPRLAKRHTGKNAPAPQVAQWSSENVPDTYV